MGARIPPQRGLTAAEPGKEQSSSDRLQKMIDTRRPS